jgi:hypothetical protein
VVGGGGFCLTLLLLLLLLLAPLSIHAQSASLTYGQTVTGHITNDSFRTVYTFEGRQGDIVDVMLRRTDGNLDPMLILTDDQNNLIARNDDSAASFDAALLSQQLPRDGLYFLIVTRFGQERGMTVGSYSLTLSHVGLTSPSGATLQYGDSVVGELGGDQFQQVYAFQATRGDIIRAAMQRISGNLDPLLVLADAQGTVMVVNDEDPDSPGSLDAAITDLRIKKTGTYLLVATRFGREAGESHGGYSLTLDRLPPQSLGKVPEKAILLDYGSSATGAIDSDNLMRFYLIDARKGDVLSINVERTRGNLDPTLTLLTADLKELAANDSGQRGQNARISTYIVPADGDYILMVSRFNRDKGITAGSYTLSLVGRIGVTVGPGGKATLPYNSAVNAIIDDGNVAQQYTFAGTAGDVVTISMETSSGNLACQLVLLDPSRKQIALDDPGTGSARLSKLKLSATGTYTIVASRRGREKGTTRGAYLLMLTREK